jgi:methionine synthase II (cobalamin-independent)
MLKTYDVGSTPVNPNSNSGMDIFIDKIRAGVDFPKYGQTRSMIDMFLDSMDGIRKVGSNYELEGPISISPEKAKIEEVKEIEKNSKLIYEKIGKPFNMGICVTGPNDLVIASFPKARGAYRNWLFQEFGDAISKIVENNIFSNKEGRVSMVDIDEASFGTFDDPEVSFGSEGREYLLKSWESISRKAKSKNVEVGMHLHSTVDKLPWEVKSLKTIGSHVNDKFLYEGQETKKLLEKEDKFLKASITKTIFDDMVGDELRNSGVDESSIGQRMADIWTSINNGKINPMQYVESPETMEKRLDKIVKRFGEERVPYAGPECGFKSFPTYESAIKCLERVSQVVHSY